MILEGAKQMDAAKTDLQLAEQKEGKIKKELKKAAKKAARRPYTTVKKIPKPSSTFLVSSKTAKLSMIDAA